MPRLTFHSYFSQLFASLIVTEGTSCRMSLFSSRCCCFYKKLWNDVDNFLAKNKMIWLHAFLRAVNLMTLSKCRVTHSSVSAHWLPASISFVFHLSLQNFSILESCSKFIRFVSLFLEFTLSPFLYTGWHFPIFHSIDLFLPLLGSSVFLHLTCDEAFQCLHFPGL